MAAHLRKTLGRIACLLMWPLIGYSQIPEIEKFDFGRFVEPPWEAWKPLVYRYVNEGGDLDWHVPQNGYSLLDFAIIYHDDALVERLLDAGILKSLAERWPLQSVLMHAVQEDLDRAVGLILDSASSLEMTAKLDFQRLLLHAVLTSDRHTFSVLFNYHPEVAAEQKAELLLYAIVYNQAPFVRYLLELGWSPDATYNGWSAATAAVFNNKQEMLVELHGAGASLSRPDGMGITPFGLAVALLDKGELSDYSVLDFLVETGVSPCDAMIPVDEDKMLQVSDFLLSNSNDTLDSYFQRADCVTSK